MAESIQRFNTDNLTLYMSVPSQDLSLFKKEFEKIPCNFITDEEILSLTAEAYGPIPELFPSHLLQQLIKLEFWRLEKCKNYIWIDSDAYFLRPFRADDFFDAQGRLITITHHADELRSFSKDFNPKIAENLDKMLLKFKPLFKCNPNNQYFGDPPLLWSCKVLESLNTDYLATAGKTIYKLLYDYPCEMQLYGEYLLFSKVIDFIPQPPIFKFFHYAEQFFESQKKGESEYSLSKEYFGVVMQSNWTDLQEKKKNDLIRVKRFLKREKNKILRLIKF